MRRGVRMSTAPDGLHPGMPRELPDVLGRPLSMILARSWCLGAVPEEWKRARSPCILKKLKMEDLGE